MIYSLETYTYLQMNKDSKKVLRNTHISHVRELLHITITICSVNTR